jgi:hypothetical protein
MRDCGMISVALETPSGGNRPRHRRYYCARTLGRECGGYNTPRGGRSPRLLRRFELPAPALFVGPASKADQETPVMTSPYLNRPLLPLAVALPRMLETIEAELAIARPAEKWRLRQRAELVRGLLALGGEGHLRRD